MCVLENMDIVTCVCVRKHLYSGMGVLKTLAELQVCDRKHWHCGMCVVENICIVDCVR